MSDSPTYTLTYDGDAPPVACATLDDLATAIDMLHERFLPLHPLCACLHVGALEVDFGLGAARGFVLVQVSPFDGEWYVSSGDASAEGFVTFIGVGGDTAFEESALVPIDQVKAAVVAIAANRSLPDFVNWRDWDDTPVRDAPWANG